MELGQFQTECPNCGGQLYLLSATVVCQGVAIEPDGFDLYSGDEMRTEDETVMCDECGYRGPLEYTDEELPLSEYNLSDLYGDPMDDIGGYELPSGNTIHYHDCYYSGQDCEVGCQCQGCPYYKRLNVEEF